MNPLLHELHLVDPWPKQEEHFSSQSIHFLVLIDPYLPFGHTLTHEDDYSSRK